MKVNISISPHQKFFMRTQCSRFKGRAAPDTRYNGMVLRLPHCENWNISLLTCSATKSENTQEFPDQQTSLDLPVKPRGRPPKTELTPPRSLTGEQKKALRDFVATSLELDPNGVELFKSVYERYLWFLYTNLKMENELDLDMFYDFARTKNLMVTKPLFTEALATVIKKASPDQKFEKKKNKVITLHGILLKDNPERRKMLLYMMHQKMKEQKL